MPLMVKSRRCGVLFGGAEAHLLGVAAVAVGQVGAEGGHLELVPALRDQDHAEVGAHHARVGEERLDLRPGVAEVAMSISSIGRPRMASRTQPPAR